MPPFTGTTFAISNLLQGIQSAQGPRGQKTRQETKGLIEAEAQRKALRNLAIDTDWDSPNAPLEYLRGAASIDPGMGEAAVNAHYNKVLRDQEMSRRAELADIAAPLAQGGFDYQDIATVQTEALRRDIPEPDFLTPYDYNLANARMAQTRKPSGGSDTALLNNAQKLYQDALDRGVPEIQARRMYNDYLSSGGALVGDYGKLSDGELFKPDTARRDQIENLLINNPEFLDLAEGAGVLTSEKRKFLGIDRLRKDKPIEASEFGEALLGFAAAGQLEGKASPQLQFMLDQYRKTIGTTQSPTDTESQQTTTTTKKIKGFGGN